MFVCEYLRVKINFNFVYILHFNLIPEMVKRTSTIQATIKDAKKMTRKPRKTRTSTINETIATSDQGFKKKRKPTKTRTMVQTINEGNKPKSAAKPKKAKKAGKTKKVAKKPAKKGGKKGKK